MFEIGPTPPQLSEELLADLAKVEVATVGHWRLWGFCDRTIERRSLGPAVAGTAITVSCPRDDNSALHHAIELARPGDVLMVDRIGDRDIACLGEVVAAAAKIVGVGAVIIDGPCTDIAGILEIRLPVWARGVAGRTTRVRGIGGRINVPISVGGVVVMPGDAILCDDNGVLVLPPRDVAVETAKALAKQEDARKVLAALREGGSIGDLSGARNMFTKSAVIP